MVLRLGKGLENVAVREVTLRAGYIEQLLQHLRPLLSRRFRYRNGFATLF
jgi:hypothetical protein